MADRTSKQIQEDFNQLAFRAGHLQHDIWQKEKDLKMFNETLAGFQAEYTKVKAAEDEAAKAAPVAEVANVSST